MKLKARYALTIRNMKLSMLACLRLFLLISLCVLLSACGFHLRSSTTTLAPELQTMYLATSAPNDPFIQQLERLLIANGVTLVKDPSTAKSTLNILSIQSTNTMVNSGGINVSGFYTAYLVVTFSVTNASGTTIIPQTTLQQSQNFSSSASQYLSGNATAADLTASMQQALAQNILNQLSHANIPTN